MRTKTVLEYAGIIEGYEFARDKVDDIYFAKGYDNYCNTHFHKQMELYYIVNGCVDVVINKVVHRLSKGHLLVCNSFDVHTFTPLCKSYTCVVSLPTRFLAYFEKCCNSSRFEQNIVTDIKDARYVYNLMQQIAINQTNGDLCLLGYSFLIFDKLREVLGLNAKNTQEDTIIFKIINYINDNYMHNINLQSLSTYCGYSKNHISKEFNAAFNCNLNEYINLVRLQAFISTHMVNNDNIITNALAVGFNSARTFYNAFKEHYNITPKEYFATYIRAK